MIRAERSACRRRMLAAGLALCFALPSTAAAQTFSYHDPGDLISDSGQGNTDTTIFAPGMRFPIEAAPAYANSQVYNPGGYLGPGGGQCDEFNYSSPRRDNFCEIPQGYMPLCPSGEGHQGQDIRPATCDDNAHWAVAATDGTITNVGSYSVYLTDADGVRYDYLHMGNVQVSVGETVTRGQRLGYVSNEFGGTPTTIHLHFNLRMNVDGLGSVYVPPYTSLVASYGELVDSAPTGYLDEASCDGGIRGWVVDHDDAEQPIEAILDFEGDQHAVLADLYRGDLCENLGFCDHGFHMPAPLSLFDGSEHGISAGAAYGDQIVELFESPKSFACEAPDIAGAGLRRIDDLDAWGLSAFWDEGAHIDADVVAAQAIAEDFDAAPKLLLDEDTLYLHDQSRGELREVSVQAQWGWRFDAAAAAEDPSAIDALPIGDPLPARPILVERQGEWYVVDGVDPLGSNAASSSSSSGASGSGSTGTGVVEGAMADSGCACRQRGSGGSSGTSGAWWLLAGLGLTAFGRRLRRSAPRRAT